MTINKKFLQFFACILILVFHLWINVSGTLFENFIIKSAYIGVDIFFLLSAYSLADKKIEYKSFIKNRFINIYLKFIIFTFILFIYKKIKLIRLLKIVLGIELIERGGGSFLWFIPAIMVFYLVYPLFINWKSKYKGIIVLIIYVLIGLYLSYFTSYRSLFIFINRIPILLTGYYLKISNLKLKDIYYYLLFVIGLILLYLFGYKNKLNIPIKELFYISSIVLIISICGLSTKLKDNKLIDLIASISLEVYAIQMIFGYDIAAKLFKLIGIPFITNILTFSLVILISYALSKIINPLLKKL